MTIPPGVSLSLQSFQPGDLRSTLYSSNGMNEWQGPITLTGNGSVNFCDETPGSPLTLSGPIVSSTITNMILRGNIGVGAGLITGPINIGTSRIEKTETATWTLMTNNNVWGDTIVHSGVLRLGTNNVCPTTGF